VVKKAQGQPGFELLTRTVLEYITGDSTGTKHNPKFVYMLYLAINDFGQAAVTAITIANEEQKMGQYTQARSVLFDIHQQLSKRRLVVPNEIKKNLLLLHTYELVKKFTAKQDTEAAARLLLRVAKSISKFPRHIVKILTSSVIWCHKAGLKKSAWEYASKLMSNDTRKEVDAKFRKKIEALVRRPATEEKEEKLSPCPFCSFQIPETLLDCPDCKNSIPYCATTGKHMLLNDCTFCPSCNFPHLYSEFLKKVHASKTCDMCNQTIQLSSITKVDNAKAQLLGGDEKKAAPGGGGANAAEDSKLTPELERKAKAAEAKMKNRKEEALEIREMAE